MVMNMFDTGLVAAQKMESNKVCANELISFNYNLFDDGSLFENKSNDNYSSISTANDVNLYDKAKMVFPENTSLSETSNFLFNFNQPLCSASKWSNGDSSDTVPYNSFPSLTGFDLLNNNLKCGSPTGQSRIMNYINNALPKPVSEASISPAQSIESMTVRDFLNHTSGTLSELEISSDKSVFNCINEHLPCANSKPHFSEDFQQTSYQLVTNNENEKLNDESSNSDNINVWSSLDENKQSLQLAAPAPNKVKNAWSKPLRFEPVASEQRKTSTVPGTKPFTLNPDAQLPKTLPHKAAPTSNTIASVGNKVSELDDFNNSTSTLPKKPAVKVPRGGFQVVGTKKSKSAPARNNPARTNTSKNNHTKINTAKSDITKSNGTKRENNATKSRISTNKQGVPPLGVEKCHYGGRCLFGTECSRWHSSEDQSEFNKQKLPNGARKCPWGAKCFRKEKCINFHSKEEVEQFKH